MIYLDVTARPAVRPGKSGFDTENKVGLQERVDFLRNCLYHTDRVRSGVVSAG